MARGLSQYVFALVVLTAVVPCTTAHKEITCLTFDQGFSGLYGVWTQVKGKVTWDGIGSSGRCADFDGMGGHIDIPRFQSAYDSWSQFSISMWYKRMADYRMVLLNTEMCGDRSALKIMFYPDNYISVSLNLPNGFGVSLSGVGKYKEWNHMVMTWNGQQIRLFLNGNGIDAKQLPGNGKRMYNSRCALSIGAVPPHSAPVLGSYKGFLDQLCFYRVGLTPENVTFLYNNPSTTHLA